MLVIMLAQRDPGGPWKISVGDGVQVISVTAETLEEALALAINILKQRFDGQTKAGYGQGERNGNAG